MTKVLLVSMPWASVTRPLLGIAVLHGKLLKMGIQTRSLHLNITFSKLFGFEQYEFFGDNPSLYPFAEYLFAINYFNIGENNVHKSIKYFLDEAFLTRNPFIYDSVINLSQKIIPKFIEESVNYILTLDSNIIGLTSTYNQVFPSLLLAKGIKERDKSKTIILGGASFHGEIGIEYSRVIKDIDYVFTGEADNSILKFIRFYEGSAELEEVDGIAKDGILINDSIRISDPEDISVPDYDDYFEEILRTYGKKAQEIIKQIPVESSRGCWWGQKHHCSFCGLNSIGIEYRSKSPDHTLEEIISLSRKYHIRDFLFADNIFYSNSSDPLLDKMSILPFRFSLFAELRPVLSRAAMNKLYKAGITGMQAGIESFSYKILKIMNKGVSPLQNIQFLKYAKEYNIFVCYNIITGFEGESYEDYEEMIKLIKCIMHLPPPSNISTEVCLYRFSPIYCNPDQYGYKNLRPKSFYKYLFPEGFIDLNRIAYFFEGEKQFQTFYDSKKTLDEQITLWITSSITISASLCPDFIIIEKKVKQEVIDKTILTFKDSIIFVCADSIINFNGLIRKVNSYTNIDETELRSRLEYLISIGVVINYNDKYLSLIPFSEKVTDEGLENWLSFKQNHLQPQDFSSL